MGEVYRARDARLSRDVAIKVLPSGVSSDPERLSRFEQEARAAAALNHPNILAVHDVGARDEAPYIVSELLEGETLRGRLRAGPLPARKAIEYAIQIARGLAAAHEKGIVHRDLKPENVFVTDDGRVKILDFGLAKLTERELAVAAASLAATAPPDTLPGIVLGTVGYMAPEQVRGLPADHRSDIFAFGAILYEMLSGQRAFRGDTTADTMTAILKEDPPDLPVADRHIPPALARITDRCLEKSAAARFQSAGDLAFALDSLSAHSGATEALPHAPARVAARDRTLRLVVGALVAALVLVSIAAAIGWFSRPRPETQTVRFSVTPPDGWPLSLSGSGPTNAITAPLAVSPDGRRIAFVARNGENIDRLWIRPLAALTAQELPGTDGASSPFWSPDSRSIGFFAGGRLKRIDADGGPPTTICETVDHRGGAWNNDGVIIFSASLDGPLMKVAASGGVAVALTTLAKGERGHVRPTFLPDGRHFIFTVTNGGMFVGSLDSNERTLLFPKPDSSTTMYTQGHLLFMRESTLMAQPLDLKRLALTGEPFPLAEQVQLLGSPFVAVYSVSTNGVLAYQTGTSGGNPQIFWFDRAGKMLSVVGDRAPYGDLEMSPDGKSAAVSVVDPALGTRDIWLIDLERGLRSRFTFDPSDELTSAWSPDSRTVVFNSRRSGHLDLYQKPADGSRSEEALLVDATDKFPLSWSPDGRFLLFNKLAATAELWVLPLNGDRKPFPYRQNRFNNQGGAFSPDGRWVAFLSNESGGLRIHVAPFPGPGGQSQVSPTAGAGAMRWRRDGREIFYRRGDGQLVATAVNGEGAAFQVGAISPLFNLGPLAGPRRVFDVDATGERFLVNSQQDPQAKGTPPFTVVVNALAGHAVR